MKINPETHLVQFELEIVPPDPNWRAQHFGRIRLCFVFIPELHQWNVSG